MWKVLLLVFAPIAGTLVAWMVMSGYGWPLSYDLQKFDWNLVSAALSAWSFILAAAAVVYAHRQWRQHQDTLAEQAKALAPAMRLDFMDCAGRFDPGGAAMKKLMRGDVNNARGHARGVKSAHTAALDRFLNQPHCFGKDGPALARAAGSVFAANAELVNLANTARSDLGHLSTQVLVRRCGDLAHRAFDECNAAANLLADWKPK